MKNAKFSFSVLKYICNLLLVLLFTKNSLNANITSGITNLKDKKSSKNELLKTAQIKHGPDGALFLLPYFLPYLNNLEGLALLDAGCGDGTWSVLAAKNGAVAYGIDIQESMIVLAKQAASTAGVSENAAFTVGNVENLPYLDNLFDRAISINVGCNLSSLQRHIEELHRVLKKGALAIITSPISLGFVFTDGKKTEDQILKEVKNAITNNPSELAFKAAIQSFNEIYRATFMKRDGNWKLVENESDLVKGEKIWRKIPRLTSANFYHPVHEYFAAFEQYGFTVKKIETPHFHSEEARLEHNKTSQVTLSDTYTKAPPFIIFVVEKK